MKYIKIDINTTFSIFNNIYKYINLLFIHAKTVLRHRIGTKEAVWILLSLDLPASRQNCPNQDPMKKLYSAIAAILFCAALNAQTAAKTNEQPSNCYTKWEQKFEERGAEEVKDGVYDDIIITVRTGAEANCWTGKVEVKNGAITAMWRKLQDGTYEEYKPKLKFDVPIHIVNGISKSMLGADDELINVIFPKTLKPKKVGYSSAPEPPQD